jgi:transposase
MDHFGGLDVSVKETSICIVDDTGRIVKEVKVPPDRSIVTLVRFPRRWALGRIAAYLGL